MRRPVHFAVLTLLGVVGWIFSRTGRIAEPVRLSVPALPILAASSDACPLSPGEEQKAVEKFDEMWPVLHHPRCLNCHGGVRPRLPVNQGNHRLGGQVTGINQIEKCQECHDGLPGWDTAPEGFFFTGKSARDLCMQFKRFEGSPTAFVKHIYNDKGGTAFTVTAFKGDRALNEMAQDLVTEAHPDHPFQAEPPPMSHGEFVQIGSDWANLVGEKGWKATPDCGCGRKKKSWTGTIDAVWTVESPGVKITETLRTNVRFELDSTFDQGPDDFYWSSVSGKIQWSSLITGRCRASASGTVRIGLGGDENPMGNLHLQTDRAGGPRYFVGIGPWRDADQPAIAVTCDNVPETWPLNSGGIWWGHPPGGMESTDGKALQGRYTTAIGPATVTWTWDLQLDQ